MFGSLFNSVATFTATAVKAVAAPIEIVVDIADAVAKPIGDAAQFVAKEVKQAVK